MSAHFDIDRRTGTYDTDEGVKFLYEKNSRMSDIDEFTRRVSNSHSRSSQEPER